MEVYLGYLMIAFLGIVLVVLIRSLMKMYERLWNNSGSNKQNPEEQAAILLDAINEANKLREDRQRKATAKKLSVSEQEEQQEQQITPDMESKIEALWQQYKELGGE